MVVERMSSIHFSLEARVSQGSSFNALIFFVKLVGNVMAERLSVKTLSSVCTTSWHKITKGKKKNNNPQMSQNFHKHSDKVSNQYNRQWWQGISLFPLQLLSFPDRLRDGVKQCHTKEQRDSLILNMTGSQMQHSSVWSHAQGAGFVGFVDPKALACEGGGHKHEMKHYTVNRWCRATAALHDGNV